MLPRGRVALLTETMRKLFFHIIILICVVLQLSACGTGARYHIVVLQCSAGNWRYKLNNELLAAQHLYDQDVDVEILNCHDQSDVQVR